MFIVQATQFGASFTIVIDEQGKANGKAKATSPSVMIPCLFYSVQGCLLHSFY
jgi:hypothetical protein